MEEQKIYLRRKKDGLNGKVAYTLETKIKLNDKQIGIYLATLPNLNKLLELITGEVSESYIRAKIEKRLKVSSENKCLDKSPANDSETDSKVLLIKHKRIDTNEVKKHIPTQEELKQLWEITK